MLWILKPLFARPGAEPRNGHPRTLADLRPGEKARIIGYVDGDLAVPSPTVQRLMHLGLLEGEEVVLTRQALTGDPIEIRLLDYSLSLRRGEAALLRVEPVA